MKNRDVESVRSRAKFATLLRRVASAVEAGQPVPIQVAGQRVLVPADANQSVEHEASGAQSEPELQLKWRAKEASAPKSTAAKSKNKAHAKPKYTSKLEPKPKPKKRSA